MRLQTKTAIVTGAANGIGAAIARRYAAAGARVVIADIDEEQGQQNAARIRREGGEARFQPTDVSDEDQVEALFQTTLQAYGQLDILVNNAGIAHGPEVSRHFLEMPASMWRRIMAVNLDGLFHCSKRAARIMVRQGQGGCIINMSSCGATRAHRQMVAYDASKGGIEAATRATALDLAPWNIRVNALVPGAIAVQNDAPVAGDDEDKSADVIPLGRKGTPEDLAGAALFLASDDAAYITGHMYFVDGGLAAQLRLPALDKQPDPALETHMRDGGPRTADD